MESSDINSIEKKRVRLAMIPSLLFVALVWLAFIIDHSAIFGSRMSTLGIFPGVLKGLFGIFFSPFYILHSHIYGPTHYHY